MIITIISSNNNINNYFFTENKGALSPIPAMNPYQYPVDEKTMYSGLIERYWMTMKRTKTRTLLIAMPLLIAAYLIEKMTIKNRTTDHLKNPLRLLVRAPQRPMH